VNHCGFDFDDDVALHARLVEEQINEELVAADFDALLTTTKLRVCGGQVPIEGSLPGGAGP
jgi:hypothetical protein